MVIELSTTTKDLFPPECKQVLTKVKIVFDHGRLPILLRTHIQTNFAFDLINRLVSDQQGVNHLNPRAVSAILKMNNRIRSF